MVKHTEIIRRQETINSVSMFDHFVGLRLKGLRDEVVVEWSQLTLFQTSACK